MKKLVFGLIATVLLSNLSFGQEEKIKEEVLPINQILEKITELGDTEGNIVTFEIRRFEDDKEQFILRNVVVEKDTEFLTSFMKGYDQKSFDLMRGKVTITCMLADGNAAQTSCGRKDGACIGKAVSECIDAGGCATVCSAKGTYIPENLKDLSAVLPAFNENAQKSVKLIDIKGSELAIIINIDKENSFSEFFLFQYENIDLAKVLESKEIYLQDFGEDYVRLNTGSETLLFTLDSNLKGEKDIVYEGYGISHRKANYTLEIVDNPITISDDLLIDGKRPSNVSNCTSGGVGSTECSIDSSPIVGGGSCSVKCGKGYYSCCDDTRNSCSCKAEKKSISTAKN